MNAKEIVEKINLLLSYSEIIEDGWLDRGKGTLNYSKYFEDMQKNPPTFDSPITLTTQMREMDCPVCSYGDYVTSFKKIGNIISKALTNITEIKR